MLAYQFLLQKYYMGRWVLLKVKNGNSLDYELYKTKEIFVHSECTGNLINVLYLLCWQWNPFLSHATVFTKPDKNFGCKFAEHIFENHKSNCKGRE